MNIWERLVRVIYSDMTALTWTLGWIAQTLAMGFFFSQTNTGNYNLLNSTLPKEIWGIFFAVYGAILLISCMYKIRKWVVGIVSIIGIWLWCYLFFSFAIFDKTPIASTEWMLLLPITVQLWVFFGIIIERKRELQSNDSPLTEILLTIHKDIKSLSDDLSELNSENMKLKQEVLSLMNEVSRIRVNYETKVS